MDIQAPIVVIGAGRSGSTLLARLLNANPALDFKGETSFLLLRLWAEVWGDRFWLNWPRHVATGPRSAADPLPPLSAEALASERLRVGRVVAGLFVELLRVDRDRHRLWGFKELWSGLPQYDHAWQAYDAVLPGASWIHLVRHPFAFARSCAAWNGARLTREYLRDRLINWVWMLGCNRLRGATGRFVEIRFEDLIRRPAEVLQPFLDARGLHWEVAMDEVLRDRTMVSRNADGGGQIMLSKDDAETLIGEISGLGEAMVSLNYRPPEQTALATDPRSEGSIDLRDPEDVWNEPFAPRFALEAELYRLRSKVLLLESALKEAQQQLSRRTSSWPELRGRNRTKR